MVEKLKSDEENNMQIVKFFVLTLCVILHFVFATATGYYANENKNRIMLGALVHSIITAIAIIIVAMCI